jgi:outer membrane protein assembly complex protein YaeT
MRWPNGPGHGGASSPGNSFWSFEQNTVRAGASDIIESGLLTVNNDRNLTLKQMSCGVLTAVIVLFASACRDGEGVVVRHLAFEGVAQVSEADLRLAVTTTGSGRLPWSQKTFFSRQDFDEDLKRLESFYASRGFPDARVASFRTVYNAPKTEMDLTVVIKEGQPVVIESVEFTGFEALPPDHVAGLRARMALDPGQPRDEERVEVVRGMVLDELRDHGYPGATVKVVETPGLGPRRVVITYAATPGVFTRFGDVVIRGNTTVDAGVILRQMAFKKGDAFSLTSVQTSQRRLYALDLFQFANVEVGDATQIPGTVPINITVIEAPHHQFTFGVGYGSEDHARVQANWRNVNFLGGARTATVESKFSSFDRGVRLSFNDPSIGGGVSLGASGQSWYASTPAYTLRTNGGRLGLLHQLSSTDPAPGARARESMSLSVAREYESYQVSDAALADPTFRSTLIALGLNPTTGTGRGTVSAVTFDAQRNTVANLLDARSGSLISLHGEVAARVLGGDFAYREASGELRAYAELTPSAIVAVHARLGSIGAGTDPATSVPFFKRYFLGGATSLRGWGRFEVAPLTAAGLPIGGYSMLESSGELRLTPGVNGAFGIVGFVDAGNVWNQSWRWYPNDVRVDAGVGLRYRTPVGPLRFDFAYQITPNEALVLQGRAAGDYRRWRLHFSIGQAF